MSQNYKADSTAYPYIDDENTPCQFSSATMGSVCTPGQRPNNSIFFGTAPKMGISYVGVDFLVTIDDETGYETSIAQHTPFVDFRETDSGFGFGDNFSQTITTGVWGPTSPASWNYYFNAGYQANLFRGYQVDYHRLFSGNTTVSWNLTNRTLRYHPMVKPSRKCICLVPHLQVRRELPDNAAIQANPGLIHSWVNDTQTVTVRNYTNNVNKKDRSIMNVPFVSPNEELDAKFVSESAKAGLSSLKGHKVLGGMRASIYNAMPIEGVKALIDFMKKFEMENK